MKKVYLSKKVFENDYNAILSVKHEVNSYSMKKISISSYEDRRCCKLNSIDSNAYGHYNINPIM